MLTSLLNSLKRLPIPDLGPVGTIIGVIGLFAGTLMLGLLVAVVLRGLINSDALNPFATGELSIPTATPYATPNPEFLAPTVDIGNTQRWQGNERVTILLMGGDTRPDQQGVSRPRTDSMMLLMIDPDTQTAGVLSIPRDLYVEVPGHGLNRINTAYAYGGGDLAVETVQYNLGVHINYYVLVEFNAFITLIDEIGGITVYVPRTIYDETYPDMDYGYDPFYIEAGEHHMDGETALKYARTRHGDNDFYRARRQQAVLLAIRERVLRADMLPELIQKAPTLYNTTSRSITTNMTLQEMTSLALLAEDISSDNIRTGVIDADYTYGYYTDTGANVLIPQRDRIGELLSTVFWITEQ